jgi:Ser/Thr protein kinase RdoA (MazF antagonist)
MTLPVDASLCAWGLEGAPCTFVAGRENQVFRVTTKAGDFALRIKRPGYRDEAELLSELNWLQAMERAGLHVPRPLPSRAGRLLEKIGALHVDMVSWLPGKPLGKSRQPLELADRCGTFFTIGAAMARLHAACDSWQRPDGFKRCHWHLDGLLGEAPVWDRFWDNPTLPDATRTLFVRFRSQARDRLTGLAPALDYGLIHADLVRENLLLDGDRIALIDFDDGGFGFRAFDMATVLLKNRAEPDYADLRAALIEGYGSVRSLDLADLDLFIALRALTYVGWIITRMDEPGGRERNERFVAEAESLCAALC